MQNAWFMLTSPGPGGAQFAILGGTGDGYDGCDSNTDTGCDGLQGTSADIITVTDRRAVHRPARARDRRKASLGLANFRYALHSEAQLVRRLRLQQPSAAHDAQSGGLAADRTGVRSPRL